MLKKKRKKYNAEETCRNVCDWQTADPTTAVFTAEYARTGSTAKREGDPVEGNPVEVELG